MGIGLSQLGVRPGHEDDGFAPPEGLRRPRAARLIVYGRKDRMDDRSRVAPSYPLERCPPFVLVPMSVLRRGILKELHCLAFPRFLPMDSQI